MLCIIEPFIYVVYTIYLFLPRSLHFAPCRIIMKQVQSIMSSVKFMAEIWLANLRQSILLPQFLTVESRMRVTPAPPIQWDVIPAL